MARRQVRFSTLTDLKRHKAAGAKLSGRHLVLSIVIDTPEGLTRRELAEKAGLPVRTICARVNELITEGILKDKNTHRVCGITGNVVHSLELDYTYNKGGF